MLRTIESAPGGATIYVSIDGLGFGWEPDGSGRTWDYDPGQKYLPITHFRYSVDRFRTSESAIKAEEDRLFQLELAESSDPKDRQLAASMTENKPPDPIMAILKQCRALLVGLLILGIGALLN